MRKLIDQAFPAVELALDVKAMTPRLRQLLQKQPELEVVQGKVVDVKYDPGKRCLILYRYKIKDSITGRTHRQMFTATLLPENNFHRIELTPDELKRYWAQKNLLIKTPLFYLDDLRMLICAFPYDSALPWLADALDSRWMKERFHLMWSNKNVRVHRLKPTLLGYTPEMRAAILYDLILEDRNNGSKAEAQVIGKTCSYKMAERLFADSWALWQACGDRIGLAKPEGYLLNPRLTFQRKVPGERLGGLVGESHFQKVVRTTARMIAIFHNQKIPLSSSRSPQDEIHSMTRWSDVLRNIRSDLGERVGKLRRLLVERIERQSRPSGIVHADFHHTNILVHNDHVRLIDLDEMAYGDPAVDIGRFLASLRIPSLRVYGSISRVEEDKEAFLEEYLKTGPAELSSIRLYESSSLITTAASAFRIQRPNWQEEVSLLLDEAETVLAASEEKQSVFLPGDESKPHKLAIDEKKQWSTDAILVQALLEPHLQKAYGDFVFICRLNRSRPLTGGLRNQYVVKGLGTSERVRKQLDGYVLDRKDSRSLFLQLQELRKVSETSPDSFLFSVPIAYLGAISMIVLEHPEVLPFWEIADAHDMRKLAENLSAAFLHLSRIETGYLLPPVTWKKETTRLESVLQNARTIHPEFADKARVILHRIAPRLKTSTPEYTPGFINLSPENVFWHGSRAAILFPDRLRATHRFLDVAKFISQLYAHGLRHRAEESEQISELLRQAVLHEGMKMEVLCLYESISLLNIACEQALEKESRKWRDLLERADQKMKEVV